MVGVRAAAATVRVGARPPRRRNRVRVPTLWGRGPGGLLIWSRAYDDWVHRQDIRRAVGMDDEQVDLAPVAEFLLTAMSAENCGGCGICATAQATRIATDRVKRVRVFIRLLWMACAMCAATIVGWSPTALPRAATNARTVKGCSRTARRRRHPVDSNVGGSREVPRRVQRPRRRGHAGRRNRCHSSSPTESASHSVSQVQAKGRTSRGDRRRTLTTNQTAVIANETPSGPGRGRKVDHEIACRRRANAIMESSLPAASGWTRPARPADGCKPGRDRAASRRRRLATAVRPGAFTPARSMRTGVDGIVGGTTCPTASRSSQPDHRTAY